MRLTSVDAWPVGRAAVAVVDRDGVVASRGNTADVQPIASVTKLLVAYAVLVAVEEGTIGLDAAAGPPGATVRHLLAHASGLPFEGEDPIAAPGARRIYSNAGFELLGMELEGAAAMSMRDYLRDGVFDPLGMDATDLRGSPARDAWSSVDDLGRFAGELLAPTLVSESTLAEATRPELGSLPGVVPGIGRFEDNAWGLGFELHDHKRPHWMPPSASPNAFGHFGGSGSFLWVDPEPGVACACITDREFGPWAREAWPALGSEVLGR
jgi:CubicO group peptidase (beta-lactamase class C family)